MTSICTNILCLDTTVQDQRPSHYDYDTLDITVLPILSDEEIGSIASTKTQQQQYAVVKKKMKLRMKFVAALKTLKDIEADKFIDADGNFVLNSREAYKLLQQCFSSLETVFDVSPDYEIADLDLNSKAVLFIKQYIQDLNKSVEELYQAIHVMDWRKIAKDLRANISKPEIKCKKTDILVPSKKRSKQLLEIHYWLNDIATIRGIISCTEAVKRSDRSDYDARVSIIQKLIRLFLMLNHNGRYRFSYNLNGQKYSPRIFTLLLNDKLYPRTDYAFQFFIDKLELAMQLFKENLLTAYAITEAANQPKISFQDYRRYLCTQGFDNTEPLFVAESEKINQITIKCEEFIIKCFPDTEELALFRQINESKDIVDPRGQYSHLIPYFIMTELRGPSTMYKILANILYCFGIDPEPLSQQYTISFSNTVFSDASETNEVLEQDGIISHQPEVTINIGVNT